MLGLRLPEWAGLRHFCDNFPRPKTGSVHFRDCFLCHPSLLVVRVEDSGTIACAAIIPLAIECCGVVNLEKEFEQLPIAELLRIEDDFDRFGMIAMVPIRRI